MASRVPKVQQTALRQQDQTRTAWHLDHIDLLFDVRPLVVTQMRHLDFVVKVTNVANDRHVLHRAHMLDADHVFVASRGDENVSRANNVFQHNNLKTVHRRLQCTDRINFRHFHAGTRTG